MAKRKSKSRVRNYDLRTRIEEVKAKMLSGVSRASLIDIVKSAYKINRTQAYVYVQKAEAEIREVVNQDRAAHLGYHLELRRDIRRRANEVNDLAMELNAANSEAKLLGLDIAQVHVTAKVAQTIDLTALSDEQLRSLISIVSAATPAPDVVP